MRFPVFLLLGLAPVSALSASDPAAYCRAAHSSDPRAHIECLEAALQGRDAQPAEEIQVSAQPVLSEAEPTFTGQSTAAIAAEPAMVDAATEPAISGAEPPAPKGMGAEQVLAAEQSDAADEELVLHIVGTSYNSRGLGTFRTEEGQVWRETTPSPERRRLKPDKQYTARIVRSKFGGYRMHVDGVKWMKTVERIE